MSAVITTHVCRHNPHPPLSPPMSAITIHIHRCHYPRPLSPLTSVVVTTYIATGVINLPDDDGTWLEGADLDDSDSEREDGGVSSPNGEVDGDTSGNGVCRCCSVYWHHPERQGVCYCHHLCLVSSPPTSAIVATYTAIVTTYIGCCHHLHPLSSPPTSTVNHHLHFDNVAHHCHSHCHCHHRPAVLFN